jgi:hypothetical protein
LQPDANASFMLVHRALSAAFAEPSCARTSVGLEASLKADIKLSFRQWTARAGA